jgi:hypothetical protein
MYIGGLGRRLGVDGQWDTAITFQLFVADTAKAKAKPD